MASAAGDTSALRRPELPGGRRPRPWFSIFPENYLVLQFDAVSHTHAFAHFVNQAQHVGAAGVRDVYKKICVAVADHRVTHAMSLEAELVNHASGRAPRRILENAPGAFLVQRLAGAAFFVANFYP